MIEDFTIFGERCSGTDFTQSILEMNFTQSLTWKYGWKHFFGFSTKLRESDQTLFVCVVRGLEPWINSFFRDMYHLPLKYKADLTIEEKIEAFLNDEFWSFNDIDGNRDISKEILKDRNIYTGERYKNIFEARHLKLKYLIEDLPKRIDNYILVRHEDLINDFENTMIGIKNKGLKVREGIEFPVTSKAYKGIQGREDYKKVRKSKIDHISRERILTNKNLNPHYEKILGYM